MNILDNCPNLEITKESSGGMPTGGGNQRSDIWRSVCSNYTVVIMTRLGLFFFFYPSPPANGSVYLGMYPFDLCSIANV